MNTNEFMKAMDSIRDLPTLPEVVTKVIEVTSDPKSSAKDLVKVISKDQAMTAKVLKVVNSAFYALPRRIGSTDHAVAILGYNTVKNIALSIGVFKAFSKGGSASVDVGAFWRHTIGCATAASVIAKKSRLWSPDEAFTAGIVHDIGFLVMDRYFPIEMAAVLNSLTTGSSLRQGEEKFFGLTHETAGWYILRRWRFPDEMATAVRYHHDPLKVQPGADGPSARSCLLSLAEDMANRADFSVPGLTEQLAEPAVLVKFLSLENEIEAIHADFAADLETAEEFLSILRD